MFIDASAIFSNFRWPRVTSQTAGIVTLFVTLVAFSAALRVGIVPKLTAFTVENRKPDTVRREIPDTGCAGLYLVVQPSGAKSFAVRYRFKSKPRKLTLPKGITLAAARAAATDADRGFGRAHRRALPSSATA
jgi:hypothetical protein